MSSLTTKLYITWHPMTILSLTDALMALSGIGVVILTKMLISLCYWFFYCLCHLTKLWQKSVSNLTYWSTLCFCFFNAWIKKLTNTGVITCFNILDTWFNHIPPYICSCALPFVCMCAHWLFYFIKKLLWWPGRNLNTFDDGDKHAGMGWCLKQLC